MRISRRLTTFLATIIAIMVLPTLCLALEMSADMTTKARGQTITGKLYMKGNKLRQDITNPQMKMTTLVRGDKNVVWMIQPAQKSYMEMKTPPGSVNVGKTMQIDDLVNKLGGKNAVTQKLVGKETVNGYPCEKYVITQKQPRPGAPRETATVWLSKKLGIPVRIKIAGQMPTEINFTNIRQGGVSDSIFELPKGFKKMQVPAMNPGMGGMQGGRPSMPR
jgi:outer membrane lipoprotein-sorting protein